MSDETAAEEAGLDFSGLAGAGIAVIDMDDPGGLDQLDAVLGQLFGGGGFQPKPFDEVAAEELKDIQADAGRLAATEAFATALCAMLVPLNKDQVSFAASAMAKYVMENTDRTPELEVLVRRLNDVTVLLWDQHRQENPAEETTEAVSAEAGQAE